MNDTPAPVKRVRVHHLAQAKHEGRRITMLTAYDSITARIFDAAGVDALLVGDSLGDNVLGHANTIPVTLDEMIPPARAVVRAAKRAFVIVDLPFGSYEDSATRAFESAVRVMKETGADAVKIEGGRRIAEQVHTLTQAGIPVIGHLGFTPQSENRFGGKRVQGRGAGAQELLADALALQGAGAAAIVLEMVPAPLAEQVTAQLEVPTIGIGAGAACDGQVLVWTDMAGMGEWSPRFARRFAEIGKALGDAASDYIDAVRDGSFPAPEHGYQS
ncbi:3-methyl-2-oxobutanoate hydroxymethyltransferase [Rarobacter faecitabidus]|uniref:3-methyl-2-oxobutanoate hydroxymethyltransferase n=1 Tax=Rarobacter faecitabidus TaxID=13243 RepID=A0A542ZV98_RARFA|nr:3-methyl-2-oxobutanoate hydroxymethyltransferase [Rarobacter faecitabidus]TQL64262.1 3-methyl-2-oxobutanoate hydroxymethyltransferase [Rarobacter faecitabidus]